MNHTVDRSSLITPPYGYLDYLSGRLDFYRQNLNNPEKDAQIAYPEPRRRLAKELRESRHLGVTPDGKDIYLFNYKPASSVIRELGRLREIAFRAVGEGTNKARDNDRYDKWDRHIVLWDATEMEIVGSYRIGEANRLTRNGKYGNLYTTELFDYQPAFTCLFPESIELGRSFVQPKYWGRRNLDYLWWGIGAYLRINPSVRYLFGAVSISNDYPEYAKQQIVACYQHCFQPEHADSYAHAKLPFIVDRGVRESYRGMAVQEAVGTLKSTLSKQGLSIPMLFKHYSEVCEPDGTRFVDFNIDPDFSNCIDGLMLVDLCTIKPKKRARYIDVHSSVGAS